MDTGHLTRKWHFYRLRPESYEDPSIQYTYHVLTLSVICAQPYIKHRASRNRNIPPCRNKLGSLHFLHKCYALCILTDIKTFLGCYGCARVIFWGRGEFLTLWGEPQECGPVSVSRVRFWAHLSSEQSTLGASARYQSHAAWVLNFTWLAIFSHWQGRIWTW